MRALLRAWRLFVLRCRASVLLSEEEHGMGLMRDHALRLANTQRELEHVRREIDMLSHPRTIIEQALRR